MINKLIFSFNIPLVELIRSLSWSRQVASSGQCAFSPTQWACVHLLIRDGNGQACPDQYSIVISLRISTFFSSCFFKGPHPLEFDTVIACSDVLFFVSWRDSGTTFRNIRSRSVVLFVEGDSGQWCSLEDRPSCCVEQVALQCAAVWVSSDDVSEERLFWGGVDCTVQRGLCH